MQDFEFTIENGRLFILQTRNGKRTGLAAIRIAVEMQRERLMNQKAALLKIPAESIDSLLVPVFDPKALKAATVIAQGLPAGPGAATGRIAFTAATAEIETRKGNKVVLCRTETSPDDLKGMLHSQGILTSRGGVSSHAALVARQLGKVCVCGAAEISINYEKRTLTAGKTVLSEGDYISIDGSTGAIYKGMIESADSEVKRVLDGTMRANKSYTYELFQTVMQWSDKFRTLKVRTNADTPSMAKNHTKINIGQAIVDLEGNLWRWDGLFISSSYEANISTILSELKEKRLNDLKKQVLEWERILEVTVQKTEDLNQRIKTAKEELEISENNPGDIDSKRQFLLNKIKQLDDEKKLFDNKLQEQENLLESLSKELRNKEQNYSVVKEELIRKESEISNYSNNLTQLAQSCREKINVDLLNLENEVDKFKRDDDLETAEKRVLRLNAERERIGAVNLLAEDEYVKLREKVDETIKDKNEIQESIEKLHEAINKINKEGVLRLKEAFKIVNENFERLFTKLFGGGKAYLKLIQNDEDPLNSGLEIFASPPGKKMQNITLLSGGEQALTAISLLFAVFIANPSPFCILDEVDAPLDDNNVDRFCSMVEEISEKVQTKFIIVTHNRMTMSRVDRLYGVTMPEEGISQIVSVELEEAVKYAE